MPRCKSCGREIDDYQFKNYKGLCSDCIRVGKVGRGSFACFGALLLLIGIIVTSVGVMFLFTRPNTDELILLWTIGSLLLIIGGLLVYYGRK
ncbi:MAG: hypothetical protein EU529_10675 [Promethearchaeota archaeon]|nr:MAG: hypothetical protein EU529_10675 [Candidatus Lokiarchaeota archaeon]